MPTHSSKTFWLTVDSACDGVDIGTDGPNAARPGTT